MRPALSALMFCLACALQLQAQQANRSALSLAASPAATIRIATLPQDPGGSGPTKLYAVGLAGAILGAVAGGIVGNAAGASFNSAACTPPPQTLACEGAGRRHWVDDAGRVAGAVVGESLLMAFAAHRANQKHGNAKGSAVAALALGALGGALSAGLYYNNFEEGAAVAAAATVALQLHTVVTLQRRTR